MTYRNLHIKNSVWRYKIFNTGTIEVRRPDGTKVMTSASKIFDMTPDEIDRGMWKGWLHITPKDVKKWILANS